MKNSFIRTASMLGMNTMKMLEECKIAVFGVGGVGSYAFEALVRSGVGNIDIYDNDIVSQSNINRQIIATEKTVGKAKVDVAAKRAKEINIDINVRGFKLFYMPDTAEGVDLSQYDYIVDAVDTVVAKVELISRAQKIGVPVISSMGTGNKLDPTLIRIGDIYKTEGCPLARVMRRELRKLGIKRLKVAWSPEAAVNEVELAEKKTDGSRAPASCTFVPAASGLAIASEVIKDLIKGKNKSTE